MRDFVRRGWLLGLMILPLGAMAAQEGAPEVKISGGYDTEGQDRGRPVVLIAAGLGVPPQVFREAFSHVHPAPAGREPDPQQVRQNKAALMNALAKYGVTNESLDRVSNYYRYNRSRGEWWPYRPAKISAIVSGGKIAGFKVTDPGAGYSSPPTVTVEGRSDIVGVAVLSFSRDLAKNGSIASVRLSARRN